MQVADAVAALMQENQTLRADLARQQNDLSEFKRREQLLKDTLINAQQVIEAMKVNAQKEAEILFMKRNSRQKKFFRKLFPARGRYEMILMN